MDRQRLALQISKKGLQKLQEDCPFDAIRYCTLAKKLYPSCSLADMGLGLSFLQKNLYQRALQSLLDAYKKGEKGSSFLFSLAKASFWNLDWEQATQFLAEALIVSKLQANSHHSRIEKGYHSVRRHLHNLKELQALKGLVDNGSFIEVSKEDKASFAATLNTKGGILLAHHRFKEAKEHLLYSLKLFPTSEAYHNLAFYYEAKRKFKMSIYCLRKALRCKKETPLALTKVLYSLALNQLRLGFFEEGWKNFEMRFLQGHNSVLVNWAKGLPKWKGELVSSGKLLVLFEQGYGDVLLFSRFLHLVKKRFLGEVCFYLPAIFKGLFSQADLPVTYCYKPAWRQLAKEGYTHQVSLASLAGIFVKQKKDIPCSNAYLKVPSEKLTSFNPLFKERKNIKVGFVYKTYTDNSVNYSRSVSIESFFPLFQEEGVSFYSLQHGLEERELIPLQKRFSLGLLGRKIKDFSDTAALVECMDLVISPDTALVHLAGALGKRCFLLLPYSADWKWFEEEETSSWYQSIRIFRQKVPGVWKDPIQKVLKELRVYKNRRSTVGV